jgi:hypothetical protein
MQDEEERELTSIKTAQNIDFHLSLSATRFLGTFSTPKKLHLKSFLCMFKKLLFEK